MLIECILISVSLCRAVHDKPVMALTAIQTAAIVTDGITTRSVIKRGGYEADPIARTFIGRYPTWGRMAPWGTVQVIGETWLAERMKTNRRKWVRRLWWLPQAAGIFANMYGSQQNISLLRSGRL